MATDLRQKYFRFGYDDGTESTHTWQANENVNISLLDANTTFLLRTCVQEQGGTQAGNCRGKWYYSYNGGVYTTISATSSYVKAVNVASFADNDPTTQRLSGTGTFQGAEGCSETGGFGDGSPIAANGNYETECGLQIVSANVAIGDTIDFRTDLSTTDTVIPRVTIVSASTSTGNFFLLF